MKSYAVVFAPEAQDNLIELYVYIADKASPAVAERYTHAIVGSCESLAQFPHRGTRRDDCPTGPENHESQAPHCHRVRGGR